MSPDVHALTGAYVLDAVSDLERVAFERHISACDACAQEVRELRGTAARLGQAAAAEPPPWLKSQVMSKIAGVRQLPRDIEPVLGNGKAGRSRFMLRLTTVAAAVLLVASALLGFLLVREQDKVNDIQAQADALQSVLAAGDARILNDAASSGGSANVVVSKSKDKVLVFASGMPALPESQVYQAWLLGEDGKMHSAGLMPRAGPASLDLKLGTSKGFGITVERAGGAQEPTLPAVVQVEFPGV